MVQKFGKELKEEDNGQGKVRLEGACWICSQRFKSTYGLKGKSWKYEKDKQWSKVSKEAGEDGVSGFGRRRTNASKARAKEMKEGITDECMGCVLVNRGSTCR